MIDKDRTSLSVLDPAYRAPYSFDPQVSLTHSLPGSMRVSVSYSMNFGYRQQRTSNINAPFPGTPLPDEILELPRNIRQNVVDRMRPFYPNVGNIRQMESTGRSVGSRFSVRLQRRRNIVLLGIAFSGSINYSYRSGEDDNDYTNPYVPLWGLSRLEHTVGSQFRIRLPREVTVTHPFLKTLARLTYQRTNFNFNLRANTGRPYSIRSGRDLNGDQSTRDRPPGVARNTERGPGSRRRSGPGLSDGKTTGVRTNGSSVSKLASTTCSTPPWFAATAAYSRRPCSVSRRATCVDERSAYRCTWTSDPDARGALATMSSHQTTLNRYPMTYLAKRLTALEHEHVRLKRVVAGQARENAMLQEVASGNF